MRQLREPDLAALPEEDDDLARLAHRLRQAEGGAAAPELEAVALSETWLVFEQTLREARA
jgi:hypothetical protein